MNVKNLVATIIAIISLTVTLGVANNVPEHPQQKTNYMLAATSFGIVGYVALLYLLYRAYVAVY